MPLRRPSSQPYDEVVVIDSPPPCLPSRSLSNPITFHPPPTEVIDLDMSPTSPLDDHHAPRKRRRRDHSSSASSPISSVIDVDAVDDNPSPSPGPSSISRLRTPPTQRTLSRDPSRPHRSNMVVSPLQATARRNSLMSDEIVETAATGPRLSTPRPSPPSPPPATTHDLDPLTPVDQTSSDTPSVEIVEPPSPPTNPPPRTQRPRRSMPSLAPTPRIPSIDSSIEPVTGRTRTANLSPYVVSDTSTPRVSLSRRNNQRDEDRAIPPSIFSGISHPSSAAGSAAPRGRTNGRGIVPFYELHGALPGGSRSALNGMRSASNGQPGPSQPPRVGSSMTPIEEIEYLFGDVAGGPPVLPQPSVTHSPNAQAASAAQGAGRRRLRRDTEVEITDTPRTTSNAPLQGTWPPVAPSAIGDSHRRSPRRSSRLSQLPTVTPESPEAPPAFGIEDLVPSPLENGGQIPVPSSSRGMARRSANVRSMMQEMQHQIQEIQEIHRLTRIPTLRSGARRGNGRGTQNESRLMGSSVAGPSSGGSGSMFFAMRSVPGGRRRSGRTSVTVSGGSRPPGLGAHFRQVVFRDRLNGHPEMHLRLFQQFGGDQHLDYENLVRLDEQLLREKNRAEKEQIDSLPVKKATAEDKEIRCCVCMCDVEEGEELRVLPCNHKYHKSCIDEWLTYNGCCPVDKKRIAPPRSRRRCPMRRSSQEASH